MRLAVTLALLVGCYQPDVPTGVRCSQSGECPAGQRCDVIRGLCDGPPIDGNIGMLADAASDVPGDTMLIDAPILGAWNSPVALAAINTADIETDPAISSDGLELFFTSDRPGIGSHDVYRSTRASLAAAFGAPTLVSELSTIGLESSAHLTAGDLTIYFSRDGQIYSATRQSRQAPFDVPILEAALSSALLDTNPALSSDGLTACVTRQLTAVDRDLFFFTRASTTAAWSTGQVMPALQTTVTDSGAEFTSDPLELYFHSDRTGGTDVYRATRPSTAAAFDSPAPVAELTTTILESDPSLTADRRILVFERAQNLMIATR